MRYTVHFWDFDDECAYCEYVYANDEWDARAMIEGRYYCVVTSVFPLEV